MLIYKATAINWSYWTKINKINRKDFELWQHMSVIDYAQRTNIYCVMRYLCTSKSSWCCFCFHCFWVQTIALVISLKLWRFTAINIYSEIMVAVSTQPVTAPVYCQSQTVFPTVNYYRMHSNKCRFIFCNIIIMYFSKYKYIHIGPSRLPSYGSMRLPINSGPVTNKAWSKKNQKNLSECSGMSAGSVVFLWQIISYKINRFSSIYTWQSGHLALDTRSLSFIFATTYWSPFLIRL